MEIKEYTSKLHDVDAVQFGDEEDIGNIIQLLWDFGCKRVTVVSSSLNPQLDISTFVTSIHFVKDGISYYLFLNDYVFWDEYAKLYTLDETDFLNLYELNQDQDETEE